MLGTAQAQSVNPIMGTWVGTSNSAGLGGGLHHPHHSSATQQEKAVRFRQVEYTLSIDRHEGRNFAGTISSNHHGEAVVGAFAKDLKSGVMVNEHGTFHFTLPDSKSLDLCFTQVEPNNRSIPKVASCFELTRR